MFQFEAEGGKKALLAGDIIEIKDNRMEFLTFSDHKITFFVMDTQLERIDKKKPVIIYYKIENNSKKMQLLTIYNTSLTRKDYKRLRTHISVVFGGL